MKSSPTVLLSASIVLTGLLLGGATAWLLPGPDTRTPAPGAAASWNEPSAKADVSSNDKAVLTNRRTRLLRLLNASAQGGGSMAQAWREAAGDPAIRAWLAEAWLKTDPAAFIRMACASDEGLSSDAEGRMITSLITQFALRDPRTALRIGPTLQPPGAGRWIMAQAIVKTMESDVAEGLALAAKHPELRLNANMDLDKIKITAADIPALLSLPPAMMVDMMVGKAANSLPPDEAMKLTSQMNQITRRSVLASVSKSWMKSDPDGALAFARNQATDQQRVSILTAMGEKNVEENPAAAADWAMENLGGNARIRILTKAAEKLEKTDPVAAEAIRARLPQEYSPKGK